MKKTKIKKKTKLKVLSFFFVVAIFSFSLFVWGQKKQARIIQDLESQVSYASENFSGNFSLAIYRPGFFNLEFGYNCDEKIIAASVIKIPILAAALGAVFKEQIELDRQVIVMPEDVVGGSGILRRIDLPISLTFESLLLYMTAISDNTAANKVIDLLGFDYINQIFFQLGLEDTVLVRKMMDFDMRKRGFENYTSSRDLNHLLKQIYKNKLFTTKLSQKAKKLLLFQQHQDRIPLHLPEGVVVAHKTGLERGVVHDAGIVYAQNSDFIISILTKNVTDYTEAKKFIAQLSDIAYNLLN